MDLQELIKEAHANSVKHGFWGIWRLFDGANNNICMLCGYKDALAWSATCPQCGAVDDPAQRDLPTKIALIHSELSEALEEFRLSDEERGGGLGRVLYRCWYDESWAPSGARTDPIVECRLEMDVTHGKRKEEYPRCPQRKDQPHKPEGFIVELADAVIRIFDLAGWMGWMGWEYESYFSWEGRTDNRSQPIPANIADLHYEVACLLPGATTEDSKLQARRILVQIDMLAQKVGGDLWKAIEIKMAYNKIRPIKHGKAV